MLIGPLWLVAMPSKMDTGVEPVDSVSQTEGRNLCLGRSKVPSTSVPSLGSIDFDKTLWDSSDPDNDEV